ncbi:MAG: hypothetical protein HY541_02635 [Deltaproteobacteria bacterium]|nr:hypothetical protein [Deltaproteobacteria bacterium]
MLDIKKIKALFGLLNDELKKDGITGEVGICGGAVMCLVFQTRKATKDVDAIFEPTAEIRMAAKKIAHREGLPEDWLNDAAKVYFHADPPRENVLEFSNLRVWAPRADYMLAMKCMSARFDTADAGDVKFLIGYLRLKNPEQVFKIIKKYYPHRQVPAKTQFFVEELFDAPQGPRDPG